MKTQFRDPTNRVVATLPGLATLSDLPIEDARGWTLETIIEADDVRAEASRRMQNFVRARNPEHLSVVLSNATREALRLLRLKDTRVWTDAEAYRAAELAQADAMIEAIRTASNDMEYDPPASFADDSNWPLFTHST